MNILGTEYELVIDPENGLPESADGLCDFYEKRIFVRGFDNLLVDSDSWESKITRYKEILAHEITHAFLWESGLASYACDETLVSWIAQQMPKAMAALDSECDGIEDL